MKKFTLIISVFVVITMNLNAQWIKQTSGTTKNLWGVSFVNQNLGYVCGDGGIILKTIDGGANWVPQNSGTTYNLAGVQFINSGVGYSMSYSDLGGIILKTVNGASWSDISLNITGARSGGGMIFSADTGIYAIGNSTYSSSKILKTVNGGVSWDTISSVDGWVSFMHFPDRNNGYATVSGSRVLKTTDGGNNWTLLNNIGGNLWMSGVYFFNKDTGFVSGGDFNTGGGSIFKTTNGGNTWQNLTNNYYTSVMLFTTKDIGYGIGGNSSAKKIIKSTDGGLNWAFDPIPTDSVLNGISFPTANVGYAVGNGGTILKTNTGSGIAENPAGKHITIFPNPANDIITLSFDNTYNSQLTLNIFNIIGKKVRSELLKQNPQQIKIGDLSNGIYIVEVKSGDRTERQKLSIKR